jgi:hypothetical protein
MSQDRCSTAPNASAAPSARAASSASVATAIPAAPPSALDAVLSAVVVLLPFTLALWRAAGGAQWRADPSAVRDQALVAVGLGGSLSTVLTQALGLLPLGSLAFRASLGAALALGVGAYLVQRIARHLMRAAWADDAVVPRWLGSVLCAVAASAVALSPSWQQEGTVGGGATVATAAALGTLCLALELGSSRQGSLTPEGIRLSLLLAALAGATLAESIPAGAAALAVLVVSLGVGGGAEVASSVVRRAGSRQRTRRPSGRLLALGLATGLGVALALAAPVLLRSFAPRSWGDVGRLLSTSSLAALVPTHQRMLGLGAWIRELGYLSLGLSALGLVVALWRKGSRAAGAALWALVLLDLVYPLAAASSLGAEPLAPLRLLGVASVMRFLLGLRVPMARTAAVLTVVFYATVVAVTCEDAGFETDRSAQVAAEQWTDEALGALPRGSALLVRSPELAWRLWAARTLRGERPDVLVVPAPLLTQVPAMSSLLPAEPALEPLLRDLALEASASEYGLSTLADARPLMVELDPAWTKRLVAHLYVEGLWLRYAPQPLGESDRLPRAGSLLAAESSLGRAIHDGTVRDDGTVLVVARTLKEHAAALSLLGMPADARIALDRLGELRSDDPFVTGARLRLAYAEGQKGRSVELRDLLRF